MASQTEKDTARAKSRTLPTSVQTQADTARAKSRQNEENRADDATSATSLRVPEMSSSVFPEGFESSETQINTFQRLELPNLEELFNFRRNPLDPSDPFYNFLGEAPSEEVVDHGVHDNTDDTLPAPVSSFSVVICRNGKPFSASIQGIVGNEIT